VRPTKFVHLSGTHCRAENQSCSVFPRLTAIVEIEGDLCIGQYTVSLSFAFRQWDVNGLVQRAPLAATG